MGQLTCLKSPQDTQPGNDRARTRPPEPSMKAQLSAPRPVIRVTLCDLGIMWHKQQELGDRSSQLGSPPRPLTPHGDPAASLRPLSPSPPSPPGRGDMVGLGQSGKVSLS